jgi:glycosyltransferase involved in cell wall biosynthesis
MVLYPWSRYHGEKKPKSKEKNLTLVNCNANKGGPVIPALARLLPTERFTCVKGSYGQQFVYPLKNVEYLENEDELLRVYGDTSVLLLPSAAEGFPTVALEAMSLGIPVAAFPIDAMKEMLGDTMPLAKRSSAPHLVATVQELLSDIKVYSKLAMLRYQQVCDIQHEQLQRLPEFIMP